MNRRRKSPRRTQRVLRHEASYGLCTTASVARLFDRTNPWARRLLSRMRREQLLFQHVFETPAGARRIHYYSAQTVPLREKAFQTKYAVLDFSAVRRPARRLVPKEAFQGLVERMGVKAKLPPQPYIPCYLEPFRTGKPRRLSLIRVAPWRVTKNLNTAMTDLQDFVATERFRLWIFFARQDSLSITYLLPGEKSVDELKRWLGHHPLVSRIESPSANVPVTVVGSVYL